MEFYCIYLDWLKVDVGIDLLIDCVLIVLFVYSCNGGIEININVESVV